MRAQGRDKNSLNTGLDSLLWSLSTKSLNLITLTHLLTGISYKKQKILDGRVATKRVEGGCNLLHGLGLDKFRVVSRQLILFFSTVADAAK